MGIKPQMIFLYGSARVTIAEDVRIDNSKIELSGESSLNIAVGCVIDNCNIQLKDTSFVVRGNCELRNLNIFVSGSIIVIENSVSIKNYDVMLTDATLTIEADNVFSQGRSALRPFISIDRGNLTLGHHNVIKCDFWIRFYGKCSVGAYNCINERTEVRCDEQVTIGSYNMISYECNIWDTNTHNVYPIDRRHQMTECDFPCIGNEIERPKTRSVIIADDCWVGKRVNILKGTQLEQGAIVGIGTTVAGGVVKANKIIVGAKAQII